MNDSLPTQGQEAEVVDATCSKCRSRGKGTYLCSARCSNCGWECVLRVSLSHELPKGFSRGRGCPRCEVFHTLQAISFLRREDADQ